MRIIAGSAKSVRLTYPKGTKTRPTTDAVRESLFSSIADDVRGARFADLYAGAGSVGIEALSRGAAGAVFIEQDHACVQALLTNLGNTQLAEHAHVLRGDVAARYKSAWERWGPFDIVFADPPYGLEQLVGLASRLVDEEEGVAPGGLIIIQHTSAQELGVRAEPLRVRKYGETVLTSFGAPGADEGETDEQR